MVIIWLGLGVAVALLMNWSFRGARSSGRRWPSRERCRMFLWSSPSPSCLIPTSACYVGGQEDMIIDVALQLRRERESALEAS